MVNVLDGRFPVQLFPQQLQNLSAPGDQDGSTSGGGGGRCCGPSPPPPARGHPRQEPASDVENGAHHRQVDGTRAREPVPRKESTASRIRGLGQSVVAIVIVVLLVVGRLLLVGWSGGHSTRTTTKVHSTDQSMKGSYMGVAPEADARWGDRMMDDARGGSNLNPPVWNRTSESYGANRTHDTVKKVSGSNGISSSGSHDVVEGSSSSRRRVPKRSPHHVYQCGYLPSTGLSNALFPEVNVTSLQHEPATGPSLQRIVQSFRPDDVLLLTCGGPCAIPHVDVPVTFPGTVLRVVGESSQNLCPHSAPRLRRAHNASIVAAFERRVTSITRIGSPRSRWNESTFNVALLIASHEEETVRDVFYKPGTRRPTNTGRHFLMYANSHWVPYREEAFRQLSSLGFEVHYAGTCDGSKEGGGNNIAGRGGNVTVVRVQDEPGRRGYGPNKVLYHDYRFTLAMEHSAVPGYVSEKILMPFLAGSVPIYYGTSEVFDIFNRNAFIWYDIHNPQPALDQILYLESNRSAYEEMLRQPILANGEVTIAKYFSIRDEDGGGRLKWAIRDRIGFG